MAGDTITLTFKVAEDGSLKAISKDAEKAAASTNKAAKASDNYNKGQKGVAQAGMNSTKAFSKMNQNLGGSNGLVAAYAGLAANIFALTAGFGALSRAARATQLEQGLVSMGQASGLAMRTLSKGLVEATGHAISLEEAMRSVALITSAGLDPSSIERFGEVARKAAGALGRDVQDSISRLTRGVTKLEPELLDELGIMVRLDEASKTYADSLGKTVSELTNFEKRQAFLNATLAEGEKKFGALEEVDVNPFDKLTASLQNLQKSAIGTVAQALSGIVNLLAENTGALVTALLLFGSTISQVVLGSLTDMANKSKESAKAQLEMRNASVSNAQGLNDTSRTLKRLSANIKDGTVSTKDFENAIHGQRMSMETANRWHQAGNLDLEEKTKRLKSAKRAITEIRTAQVAYNLSLMQSSAAEAQAAFANRQFREGLKLFRKQLKDAGAALKVAFVNATSLSGAFTLVGATASAAAAAVTTLAAGLMAAMAPVAVIIGAFTMLKMLVGGIVDALTPESVQDFNKELKDMASTTEEAAGNFAEVDLALEGQSKKITTITGAYTAYHNSLQTVIGDFNALERSGMRLATSFSLLDTTFTAVLDGTLGNLPFVDFSTEAEKARTKLVGTLDDIFKSSIRLQVALEKQTGVTSITELADEESAAEAVKIATRILDSQEALASAVRNVAESAKEAKEAVADYMNSIAVKTDIDEITGAIQNLNKALFDPDTGKFDEVLQKTGKLGQIIQESLDSDSALIFNVAKEFHAIDQIQKKVEKSQKTVRELEFNLVDANWLKKIFIERDITKELQKQKRLQGEMNDLATSFEKPLQVAQETFEKNQEILRFHKRTIKIIEQGAALEKQEKTNTLKSLENIHTMNELVLKTKIGSLKAEQRIAEVRIKNAENANKLGLLDKNQQAALVVLRQEYQERSNDIALLEGQILTDLEKNVELEEMKLTMLKEEQKAEKAILDIAKKQAAADKKSVELMVKLAQLDARNANREAGISGKLLPSQKATIELDEKVLKGKMDFMKNEAKNKKTMLALEKTMLAAKLAVLKAEIDVINKDREGDDRAKQISTEALEKAIASLDGNTSVFDQQVQNVNEELRLGLLLLKEQIETTDIQALKDAERLTILAEQKQETLDTKAAHQDLIKELQKQVNLSSKLAGIQNTDAMTGKAFDPIKAARLEETARKNKIEAAQLEFNLMDARIKAEHALLDAKYALLKAEMSKDGQIDQNEAAVLTALSAANAQAKNLNGARLATAQKELDVVKAQANLDTKAAKFSAAKEGGLAGVMAAITGSATARKSNIDVKSAQKHKGIEVKATSMDTSQDPSVQAINTMVNELKKGKLASIDTNIAHLAGKKPGTTPSSTTTKAGATPSSTTSTTTSSTATATNESGELPVVGSAEQQEAAEQYKLTLTDVRAVTQGLAADLRALGPDGEVQAMFVEGLGMVMTGLDGYLTKMVEINQMEEGKAANQAKNIAMVQAGAAALAGVNQMIQASSQKKVRAIDKEIAAEQKRDGQSAASVAKMQALQKKKEAEERKAFNKGKKLKMAITIANTAASIMTALAEPPLGLGPVAGIPLAAMMGVTGALQLAAIASTSYEGGGSSTPKGPSKVSVGERSNTVDLAKANNASGEQAYMRGEKGAGTGMTDFTPAFTGYKHRQSGGYVVGEQGPELFMPDVPGTIIPADETEALTQNAPVNVNFTIQAIDTQNMQEALVVQRGNIIGMIREAANEHGEFFLENVDDTSYGAE